MNFINVQSFTREDLLYQEEIDVILEQVDHALDLFDKNRPSKGTFILDGQPQIRRPEMLLRFNLPDGIYERQFFRIRSRNSDELAAESINEILRWPHHERYQHDLSKQIMLSSGTYRDAELMVCVLNSSYGRFLCSSFAEVENDAEGKASEEISIAIMLTVAWTLSRLCQEDSVLQTSIDEVVARCLNFADDDANYSQLLGKIIGQVQRAFIVCDTEIMQHWQRWHEGASATGELGLPFQPAF